MKFLEVTDMQRGFKTAISIDKISSINEVILEDGHVGCFIETGLDKDGEAIGFFTVESYSDIKKIFLQESKKDMMFGLTKKLKNE